MIRSVGGAFALSIFVILFYYAELIVFPLFLWAMSQAVRSRRMAGVCMGLAAASGALPAISSRQRHRFAELP